MRERNLKEEVQMLAYQRDSLISELQQLQEAKPILAQAYTVSSISVDYFDKSYYMSLLYSILPIQICPTVSNIWNKRTSNYKAFSNNNSNTWRLLCIVSFLPLSVPTFLYKPFPIHRSMATTTSRNCWAPKSPGSPISRHHGTSTTPRECWPPRERPFCRKFAFNCGHTTLGTTTYSPSLATTKSTFTTFKSAGTWSSFALKNERNFIEKTLIYYFSNFFILIRT